MYTISEHKCNTTSLSLYFRVLCEHNFIKNKTCRHALHFILVQATQCIALKRQSINIIWVYMLLIFVDCDPEC